MLPLWGQISKVLFFLQSDVFDQNCKVSDCKILGLCLTLGTCRIKCPLIGRILPRYHAESFHEIGSACANQSNVCRRSAKELSSIYESAITARLFPENPFKVHWNFHRQNWMKIQIAWCFSLQKVRTSYKWNHGNYSHFFFFILRNLNSQLKMKKREGTVFTNTDRPRLVYNIAIFSVTQPNVCEKHDKFGL